MNMLNNMTMRNRLLLVLALPVLGLLFFSLFSAAEKGQSAGNMDRLEVLAALSVKLGAAAHELQKERGMTGGFLGSKGQKFANELPVQRKETDKRITALTDVLKGFDKAAYGAALSGALDEAARSLDGLTAKREAVSAQGIAGAEAIAYYTRTIGLMLAIPRMATLMSDDSQVTQRATTYANLLFAKERVGIERALLTNAFAADKLNTELLSRFLTNASAQDVYLHEFEATATPEQMQFYKQKVAGREVDEAARMKRIAMEGIDGRKLGVDSEHWFAMVTTKINLFKEVEDRLAGDLATLTGDRHAGAQRTLYLFIVLALAALSVTAVLAFFTIQNILRQLGGEPVYAAEIARKIADGDLTTQVRTRSGDTASLLAAMKAMTENLARIVTDVRQSSDSVGSAAKQISAGNNDLSQRTQEQASALEETASSMEEMTSTTRQNADNARQANQLAVGARDQATSGGEVVTKAVAAMNEINTASKKIADIIGVIDEIAFQTNLLALNAAVEAARAGEQARGFAVVASEVRNLAQRSAGAAKEIKGLISDSVEKVRTGSQLVDESGKTLTEIVSSVKKVTDIVAEIAAASQEQSSGIDQVNKAVMSMDEVTQQNAALVEEAAAASKSMEDQAEKMIELMGFFKTGAHASASAPASATTPAKAERAPVKAHLAAATGARREQGNGQQPPTPAGLSPPD